MFFRGATRLAAAGAAALAPFGASGADAMMTVSVEEAVRIGLAHSPDLIAARDDRELQDLEKRIELSRFAPRFSISPHYSHSRTGEGSRTQGMGVSTSVDMDLPTGGTFSASLGHTGDRSGEHDWEDPSFASDVSLSVQQPLLRGAGIRLNTATIRAARRNDERHRLTITEQLIETVGEIVQAYRHYVRAARTVRMNERALSNVHDIVAADNMMMTMGMIGSDDTVKTHAQVAEQELALADARNEFERSRIDLADLLKSGMHTRFDSMTALQPEPVDLDLEMSIDQALHRRPDYRQTLLDLEDAQESYRAERNERLWDLSLNLSTQRSRSGTSSRPLGWDSRSYEVGLDLTIPFGGAARLERRRARLQAQRDLARAQSETAKLRARIEVDVEHAWRDTRMKYEHIALARKASELATTSARIALDRFHRGTGSNFEAVVLEEARVQAEAATLESVVEYLDARAELDRVLGHTLHTWNIDATVWGGSSMEGGARSAAPIQEDEPGPGPARHNQRGE